MTDARFRDLEDHACPGAGACGGQFTANTMALALEFLGLSPIGTASPPGLDPRRQQAAHEAGRLVMDQLTRGLKPRDILTRLAFENAITGVAATGGSTNAVLHLLALAREAGVPLTIDDFDTVSARTPTLADLKPGGRYGRRRPRPRRRDPTGRPAPALGRQARRRPAHAQRQVLGRRGGRRHRGARPGRRAGRSSGR